MSFISDILKFVFTFLGFSGNPNAILSKFAYPCSINNCQICSFTNFCGQCNPNFILTLNPITSIPYCQYVQCSIQNCQECYSQNFCEICNNDYFVTLQGMCSKIGQQCADPNCLTCSPGNTQICQLCSYGYFLEGINSKCYPQYGNQVENCQLTFQFSAYMCQTCSQNYVVNPAFQCVEHPDYICNVPNCIYCTSNNGCQNCNTGFAVSNGGCQALTCNIKNCEVCSNSTTCFQCITNYALNENSCQFKSYGCNVDNCITCAQSPQVCTSCIPGYKIVYQYSSSNSQTEIGSTCQQITESYGGSYPVSNCLVYSLMIPGTSDLKIGCRQCDPDYVNVGGYCVANLQLSSYQCSVKNCVYCINNNVCGRCAHGYTLYLDNYGECIKSYSPFPNCQQTSLFTAACAICEPNYVLSKKLICISYNIDVSCEIIGCQYCLQDNQCQNCRSGYTLNSQNSTCQQICDITDCYQCLNQTNCDICDSGYMTQNNGQCTEYINSQDCGNQQVYGQECSECTNINCVKCNNGYTLNPVNNQCCQTPLQNAIGCIQYENVCSNQCKLCKIGYDKFMQYNGEVVSQCIQIPCIIQNCAYCPLQSNCIVCDSGYTLNSEGICFFINSTEYQCTGANKLSCALCNEDGSCLQCLDGYQLYDESCVCPFQNCLRCQGSTYCSICAFPTISSPTRNQKQCLPPFTPGLICQNCKQCYLQSNQLQCSICQDGFYLYDYSFGGSICVLVQCIQNLNCSLCSVNQLLCYQCKPGFMQKYPLFGQCQFISNTPSKNCTQVIEGCSYCETQSNETSNTTVCQSCTYSYSDVGANGQCTANQCLQYCLVCVMLEQQPTCLVCYPNFYLALNTSNQLVCSPLNSSIISQCFADIQGCISCATQSTCNKCVHGLLPSSDGSQCLSQVCQVENCKFCLQDSDSCYLCNPTYILTSINICQLSTILLDYIYSCQVYNCLQCYSQNVCGMCTEGFSQYQGQCVTNLHCSVDNCQYCTQSALCMICQENYSLKSSSNCQPICNIQHCSLCSSFTECGTCFSPFVVSENNQCQCGANFQLVDDNCVCPIEGYTSDDNVCVVCGLENCGACSSDNICVTCVNGWILIDNQCQCPETFTLNQEQQCICPTNTLLNLNLNQCIQCIGITNCLSCSSANQCQYCENSFLLIDNQCQCPESTHIVNEGVCSCPAQMQALQNDCINCTVNYCQLCSSENTCSQCITSNFLLTDGVCSCPQGYNYYNGSVNDCVKCDNGIVNQCSQCIATNFCGTCEETFTAINGQCYCPIQSSYSQQSNTCIPCFVSNCTLCLSNDTIYCDTCRTGTTLSQGLCIACDINECVSCNSPLFCIQCNEGYFPSSDGNLCVSCNIQNCFKCSDNNICEVCNNGYKSALEGISCVSCQISGCSYCQSDNSCSICLPGYQLVSNNENTDLNICMICSAPCQTCQTNTSSINTCLTCLYPYSLYPYANGTCYTCSILNCINCPKNQQNSCLQCIPGYSIVDNACVSDCNNIQSCLICQNDECVKCKERYVFIENIGCVLCMNYDVCLSCAPFNRQICYQCAEGFYVADGVCSSCTSFGYSCKICSSIQCLQYVQESLQVSIYINNQFKAVKCDPGCQKCSHIQPTSCIRCQTGFTLTKNSYCIPCPYPCVECSADLTTCYSCANNVQPNTGQEAANSNLCSPCQSDFNCLTCNSNNDTCTSCPNSYAPLTQCTINCNNYNNQQYCLTCSTTDIGVCLICFGGYVPDFNGMCVPCPSGCSKCATSQPNICLECAANYYLSSTGSCDKCSVDNCKYCQSNELSVCSQCFDGYFVSGGSCQPKCQSPCASCVGSSTQCTLCQAGFVLECDFYGLCVCQYDPEQFITKTINPYCPFNFVLVNGLCKQCSESLPSGCFRCSSQNYQQCAVCFKGYYLQSNSNSSCQACQEGCSLCSSSNSCLQCSSGYTSLQQPLKLPYLSCVQCQSPCSQCLNNSITCVSCVSGYNLYGYSCISQQNFGFALSLQTTINNFYVNYYQFLMSIAGALNFTTFLPITIYSIKQGSVNIEGAISAQSVTSMSYSDQLTALNNLLANGSMVGNMQIIDSQLTANSIDFPDTQGSSNIGIILGIAIPLIIIILVVVFALCFKEKKKNQQNVIVTTADNTLNSQRKETILLSENTHTPTNFIVPQNIYQQQQPISLLLERSATTKLKCKMKYDLMINLSNINLQFLIDINNLQIMGNSKYLDPNIDIYMEIEEIFYIAGQQVKGCAYINAKSDRPYESLKISLIGKQYVYWVEQLSIDVNKKTIQKSVNYQNGQLSSQNKIVHQNQYINYQCTFELYDFMGTIKKGQYSFPFNFVLPMMMAGSFYHGANNFILYGLSVDLVMKQYEKSQRYSLNLNVIQPSRVQAVPLKLTKNITAGNSCLSPFSGSKKLEITQSSPFATNGSLINFSFSCEKDIELTLKIYLCRKRALISKERNTKYTTDWRQSIGVKKLSSRQTFQVEIPRKLNLPTAIGSITAEYYVIQIQILGGFCNTTNFGTMEFHLLVNVKQPKVRWPAKIPPPKDWNPTLYPMVQFHDMRPFRQRLSKKMPYFNINEEYYSANLLAVSGVLPYHKINNPLQSSKNQRKNTEENKDKSFAIRKKSMVLKQKQKQRQRQKEDEYEDINAQSDRRMITPQKQQKSKIYKKPSTDELPEINSLRNKKKSTKIEMEDDSNLHSVRFVSNRPSARKKRILQQQGKPQKQQSPRIQQELQISSSENNKLNLDIISKVNSISSKQIKRRRRRRQ